MKLQTRLARIERKRAPTITHFVLEYCNDTGTCTLGPSERCLQVECPARARAAHELGEWQHAQAERLAQAGYTDAGELLAAVQAVSARAIAPKGDR